MSWKEYNHSISQPLSDILVIMSGGVACLYFFIFFFFGVSFYKIKNLKLFSDDEVKSILKNVTIIYKL